MRLCGPLKPKSMKGRLLNCLGVLQRPSAERHIEAVLVGSTMSTSRVFNRECGQRCRNVASTEMVHESDIEMDQISRPIGA